MQPIKEKLNKKNQFGFCLIIDWKTKPHTHTKKRTEEGTPNFFSQLNTNTGTNYNVWSGMEEKGWKKEEERRRVKEAEWERERERKWVEKHLKLKLKYLFWGLAKY